MKNILMTLGIALCVVSQPLFAAKHSSSQTEAGQHKNRKGQVKRIKGVKKPIKKRSCCFCKPAKSEKPQ